MPARSIIRLYSLLFSYDFHRTYVQVLRYNYTRRDCNVYIDVYCNNI